MTILQLVQFHDHAILILVFVMTVVGFIIARLCAREFSGRCYLEHEVVEEVWTFFPGVLLVLLGYPSLELLYNMEVEKTPEITVKAIGHQ